MAVKTSWSSGDVLTAADLTDTFAAKLDTSAYSPGMSIIAPTSIAFTGTSATSSGGVTSLTACSAISLNGVFTSTYRNYRILMTLTSGTTGYVTARLRSSGSDDTSSSYYWSQRYTEQGGTTGGNGAGASTSWTVGYLGASNTGVHLSQDLYAPFASEQTWGTGLYAYRQTDSAGQVAYFSSINHSASTAYDGLTFLTSSMSGTIRVYGYEGA